METETYQASENMKLFFEKLLALKQEAKEKSCGDYYEEKVWEQVYNRLDAIIKENQ